ncbi:MAG: hypothetical protein J7K20_04275 [Thermodesulfobacterium sp.]|uniref:hypothetical protein n=1 Tax=Thermodesulfobacterium hydrogeniphilum TaxID=161156 RepID=UPI00056DF25C|nr:hypothetical protein [Thermodesulfobacterium hydrogeniphilum]MCD6489922.1 hypothetical protein [Thermodesulfobacterium sp.]
MFNFNHAEVLKEYANEKVILEFMRLVSGFNYHKAQWKKDPRFFDTLGRIDVNAFYKAKRIGYKDFTYNGTPTDPFYFEVEESRGLLLYLPALKVYQDGKKRGRDVFVRIRWINRRFSVERVRQVPNYISDNTLIPIKKVLKKGSLQESFSLLSDEEKVEGDLREAHFSLMIHYLFNNSNLKLDQKIKLAALIMNEQDPYEVLA